MFAIGLILIVAGLFAFHLADYLRSDIDLEFIGGIVVFIGAALCLASLIIVAWRTMP